MRANSLRAAPLRLLIATLALCFAAVMSQAADRAKLESFLEVTGFDVALESIRLTADSAPEMLGLEANDFGSEWSRLVNDLFATQVMHDLALEILTATLDDDLLSHGIDFYASGLGTRLVAAENRSHMIDTEGLKSESGGDILAGLRSIDSPRIAILERLNSATDVQDTSVRAIQEVQIRFLLAAARAGVIEMRMDEPDLRELLRNQEDEMRAAIEQNALASSAYTYQAFSDSELSDYADALSQPKMQKLYALMNAVQYEVMANRFEAVADRLQRMQPSQDL